MAEQDSTGLKMILSVVTFLFLIGLIIFLFSIFGDSIMTATNIENSDSLNESITFNETGYATSVAGLDNLQTSNVHVYECNPACTEVPSSNYTITGGVIYKN